MVLRHRSAHTWCVVWWDVHVMRCECLICDVVWCAIRPKNSAQELLLCVLFFRLVMCDVVRCDVWCLVRCNDVWCVMWWDFVYPAQELGPRISSLCSLLSACDVWCGEISSIRPKNSAQELLLCVLFFRLVMCDVVRCDVWCLVRCSDVWCGEISSIRPKNWAQELLLCVLFFRLVMCDVVRCDVWCLVRCSDIWCGEISSIGPKNLAQEFLLCVLFFQLVMCGVVKCDVWWLVRWCSHIVVTHSAHTWCSHIVLT